MGSDFSISEDEIKNSSEGEKQMVKIYLHLPTENEDKGLTNESPASELKLIDFPVDEGTTYRSLLEQILEAQDIPQANYKIFKKLDTDAKPIRANPKDYVECLPDTEIHVKATKTGSEIAHLGKVAKVSLSPKDTPRDLRNKFLAATGERIADSAALSVKGRSLEEAETLESSGVLDEEDPKIHGLVALTVDDPKAGIMRNVECGANECVDDLVNRFCSADKRRVLEGSQMLLGGNPLEGKKIENKTTLTYEAAPFTIEIRDGNKEKEFDADKKEAPKLEVFDHWTVAKVKEEFSMSPGGRSLTDNDRFFVKDTLLNDDTPVWRLQLEEKDVIKICPEEIEYYNLYNCADCGAELKLKPSDVVTCKHCFFRVVYKQRTSKSF